MPFCRRGSSWASMSGLTNRKELSAAKPQPKGRRDFTAETRSSQSSESILTKKLFTLRPPRLRGESSDNLRTPRKLSRIAMQSSQRNFFREPLCVLCTAIRKMFLRLRKFLSRHCREFLCTCLTRGQQRGNDPSAFFRYHVTVGLGHFGDHSMPAQ